MADGIANKAKFFHIQIYLAAIIIIFEQSLLYTLFEAMRRYLRPKLDKKVYAKAKIIPLFSFLPGFPEQLCPFQTAMPLPQLWAKASTGGTSACC